MTFVQHATITLAIISVSRVSSQSLLAPTGKQCVGNFYNPSRLEALSSESIFAIVGESFSPNGLNFNFKTRQVNHITSQNDPFQCLAERHRVRESIEGVPIYGADFVVTYGKCSAFDQSTSRSANTLVAMDPSMIESAYGYIVTSVAVPTGYVSKRSREEAVKMVASLYQVAEERVTSLALEIYPTDEQDYRAWIGTVLDDKTPGEPRLYQVVVDDESEQIILQCEISGLRERSERRENLSPRIQAAGDDEPLDASLCEICAVSGDDIAWFEDGDLVECDVQTLYLSNVGRKSQCITGMDTNGNNYTGPGPVPELHFLGTLNCYSTTVCELSPMSTCQDAIHDVHWGAINYLQYMQEHLGVMGGLVKDGNNPVPVIARTHFDFRYCNAFYDPGEHTVSFGDCDCHQFTPLASTDVVVHEITHGMTAESSGLLYFLESGGLNEAYSDIMACALEFNLNDLIDLPDFTVGESITKSFLRHMEFPSSDGKSIDSYCDYEIAMPVHYSSGFLNKAYVNSVRRCASLCGTTAECAVLIGNTFMYTNLETLSMASNFLDAAEQTCKEVGNYFAAHSPPTNCTINDVRDAVVVGFQAVGVDMHVVHCRATVTCQKKTFWEQMVAAIGNLYELAVKLCKVLNGQRSSSL